MKNKTKTKEPKGFTFSNLEEAKDRLAYWQKSLNLQQWNVNLLICRGNGLDIPEGTQGECFWTIKRLEATIKLLDPIDFPKTSRHFPQDHEVTLVHELLHLHAAPFDSFKTDGPEDVQVEQMVQSLAKALVRENRGW